MPKKRKNELIRCLHFLWRIACRDGVWYADGRTNLTNVGRHSLGTHSKAEALRRLPRLDEFCAVKLGLAEPREVVESIKSTSLSIAEGRGLFEQHISRSRITGGVKTSTKKRYRAAFDKFYAFTVGAQVPGFSSVDADLLNRFASHLESQGYAQKTVHNELTTIKVCVRWLIESGNLPGRPHIKLPLRRPESQRAYCYRPVEIKAIVDRCREVPELNWLGGVVTALACTGMRIDELVNLRWDDMDFEHCRITLAEESNQSGAAGRRRSLKSGKSRSFPIHSELLVVLKALSKIDAYVFHGPRKGRLKADTVRSVLVRDVIRPLAAKFTNVCNGKSFIDGRLHSFRHAFVSACAAANVPERVVMEWVGHADSTMVRHYFHLHDEEAQRQMKGLDLLGKSKGIGWSDAESSTSQNK